VTDALAAEVYTGEIIESLARAEASS